jgi:hypothetical protein
VLPILAPNGKWSAERYLNSKSRAPCEQPQRTRKVTDKPQVTMATGTSVLVHGVDEREIPLYALLPACSTIATGELRFRIPITNVPIKLPDTAI